MSGKRPAKSERSAEKHTSYTVNLTKPTRIGRERSLLSAFGDAMGWVEKDRYVGRYLNLVTAVGLAYSTIKRLSVGSDGDKRLYPPAALRMAAVARFRAAELLTVAEKLEHHAEINKLSRPRWWPMREGLMGRRVEPSGANQWHEPRKTLKQLAARESEARDEIIARLRGERPKAEDR